MRPQATRPARIDTASGTWTPELEAAYVERVLSALEPHVENWPAARGTHAALSPVELERRNPNLVRGDIYSGDCELGQSYLWRPLPSYGSHRTPGARSLPVRRVDLSGTGAERRVRADRRARRHRRRAAARTSGPPAARTALRASRTSSPRRGAGASSLWATL